MVLVGGWPKGPKPWCKNPHHVKTGRGLNSHSLLGVLKYIVTNIYQYKKA